jgi:hypothetical protein
MSAFARNRIRLAVDGANPFADLVDQLTSATPSFPHGRNINVEVALFNNTRLDSLASVTSLTLSIKDVTSQTGGVIEPTAADLLTKTVNSASFNLQLTQSAWDTDTDVNGSSYHAAFQLTSAEVGGISMSGQVNNIKSFGLVISATTSIGIVCLVSGVIKFRYDGAGATVGTPPTAAYTFTDAQLLAMLATKLNAGENDAGVSFILRGPNGKGLNLYIDDSSGAPILKENALP